MTDIENKRETSFSDEKGEEQQSTSPSLLVYYNALSRVVMAGFLIAAGVYTLPTMIATTPRKDFQYCSIFFIIGTGLFWIVTILDFVGIIGDGLVAILNSSFYVIGAGCLEVGSIFFYPGVDKSAGADIGQYLYVIGTLCVIVGLLWVSVSCFAMWPFIFYSTVDDEEYFNHLSHVFLS